MDNERNIRDTRLIKGQVALAKELGVTQQTISVWQSQGKFADCFTRIGKKYLYDLDAILAKFAG